MEKAISSCSFLESMQRVDAEDEQQGGELVALLQATPVLDGAAWNAIEEAG